MPKKFTKSAQNCSDTFKSAQKRAKPVIFLKNPTFFLDLEMEEQDYAEQDKMRSQLVAQFMPFFGS